MELELRNEKGILIGEISEDFVKDTISKLTTHTAYELQTKQIGSKNYNCFVCIEDNTMKHGIIKMYVWKGYYFKIIK